MGAIAPFDYAYWQRTYPEYDYLGSDQVQPYFDLAGEIHANDGTGPVCNPDQQKRLVHLMTAHIVKLFAPGPTDEAGNTTPAQDVVGRIATAGEGSVNITTENNYAPGSAQWYQQTKYGSMYYLATSPFRSARWVGPPLRRPSMGPAWQYSTSANWPWP